MPVFATRKQGTEQNLALNVRQRIIPHFDHFVKNMPETLENKAFLHALNLTKGLFPMDLYKLRDFYQGDLARAWHAPEKELSHIIEQDKAYQLIKSRRDLNPEKEFLNLEHQGISACGSEDQEYPKILRQIAYPPLLLYFRGAIHLEFGIGVVGSRKISLYGQQAVRVIIPDFCRLPVSIISGLAFGVDALAHKISLDYSLPTLAVLGSGVNDDSIYPRENLGLANKIIELGGAIISEFPPGTPALKIHFPMRNRIIAGMSRCVVVIEAGEKSGALITAHRALEQNRDVFAVPGSIFEDKCLGTNQLIKSGAIPLTDGLDLINHYPELQEAYSKANTGKQQLLLIYKDLTGDEQLICSCLPAAGCSIDKICQLTNLPVSKVNSAIVMLEIKGVIAPLGNNFYAPILPRRLTRLKKGS